MDKITDKGGHFCLQLKRNQRAAFDDVLLFFDDMEKNRKKDFENMDAFCEITKDHGRIEKREYYVCSNAKEIAGVLGSKWKHVKCLGMARLTRNSGEDSKSKIHFHLLDTPVKAEEYAGLARGHWAIG